jgi:4-hydroxybenzoate polyprenyltransferase
VSARDYASLIKLSHSVFAMPFALLALIAADPSPSLRTVLLCIAAVVCARTAAMAYNRYVDRDIDAKNPRTKGREIPRGAIAPRRALLLALGSGAAFLACCVALGPVCAWMGAPVLLWLLLYSHAKRFTALCHLWLGVALGLAPLAAWVAARGSFEQFSIPLTLALGVVLWVAGFDVCYACQDEAFDRANGLHSIPARIGVVRAMWLSRAMHLVAAVLFAAFGVAAGLGTAYAMGVLAATLMLAWQHWLLRRFDLRNIHSAFFTANGILSVVMLAAGLSDIYLFA